MDTNVNPDWSSDRRLDILVLGPMGEDDHGPASTLPIRDALDALLEEEAFQTLLDRYHIQSYQVHVPEGQNQPEIFQNVLSLLDTADLVVFNLTPKQSSPDRANVFYELGLVHALGIPAMMVVQDGVEVPFYAQGITQYRVPDFSVETLTSALRQPLEDFLDVDNSTTSFVNDRVTQFYGMPVVDISAAVGLATGYYYNFLSRLITEGGFLAEHPGAIRAVVYVRPSSIRSTYQADQEKLRQALQEEELTLELRQLEPPKYDKKGPIWFDHVNGVVLDLPRTIYPLRRSPRLLSYLERNRMLRGSVAKRQFAQRRFQIEENLLDHVKTALDFQVEYDGPRVRASLLHFTTIEEAPSLVKQLLEMG